MFARLVGESFVRNPRRKLLTAAALVLGMAVATATLTVALEVGDRMAREFRSLGANLLVTPKSDTLPLEIGGVDYRPVDEGAYLNERDLGKLKTIFWRHNILGFTPFLDVPEVFCSSRGNAEHVHCNWHLVRARSSCAGRHQIQNRPQRHTSLVDNRRSLVPRWRNGVRCWQQRWRRNIRAASRSGRRSLCRCERQTGTAVRGS